MENATFMFNNGSNTSHHDYYGPVETVVFSVWLVVIIFCSIVGNIFVILVILFVKDMRRAENGTYLFLFTLAISDLSVGIFIAPVSLYTLFREEWHLGHFLCSVNSFLNTTFLLTSIHILTYISIHKYMSVKRLSECNTLPVPRYKCYAMICASWVWGIFFALLTTVVLGEAEFKPKTTQCGPKYPVLTVKSVILSVGNLVLNFIMPFIVMLIMYVKIYYVMKSTAIFRRKSTIRDSDMGRSSGEEAAIHTLIIVISCFIVCWLPYVFYVDFIFFTSDRDTIPACLNPLAYCSGFTNSACNPIIYAFRFPDIRNGYLNILRRMCCRTTNGTNSTDVTKERYAMTPCTQGENSNIIETNSR